MRKWHICLVAALVCAAGHVLGQQAPSSTSAGELKDPAHLIQRLEQALRLRDQAILSLQRRVEALERQAALQPLMSPGAISAPVVSTASLPQQSVAPRASAQQIEEEERLARAALDRALIERGGILLPKWTAEVDHSMTYYNASSEAISIDGFALLPVLVVGDIISQKEKRDIILGAVTTRFGLPKGIQAEFRLPYGYESMRIVTADAKQSSRHALGIGDLELAVVKQVKSERGRWPGLLTSVRWKSTTGADPFHVGGTAPTLGNGFHAIQTSVTGVRTSDPAIFFGSMSYTANLPGDKGIAGLDREHPDRIALGHVNPGDSIGFNLGTALSINPEASVNFAWDQRFTRSSTLNGARVPGSFLSEGMLRLGTTYMYTAGRVVDLGLGIGMTRDTPDFQFSVSFPFRFPLKRRSGIAEGTQPNKSPSPQAPGKPAAPDNKTHASVQQPVVPR